MRSTLKAAFAGAALVAGAAGIAALTPAHAQDNQPHVMTVRLPDGGIARIQYTGTVPPRIAVAPAPDGAGPVAFVGPAPMPDPGFAVFEQMSALMQRQAALMMHQVAEMQAAMMAPINDMPAGAHVYAMSSTLGAGPGVCMRSVQISYDGTGKPNVVSRTSGDCGSAHGAPAPAGMNSPMVQPAAPPAAHLIEAKAAPHPAAGSQEPVLAMTQPVAFQH